MRSKGSFTFTVSEEIENDGGGGEPAGAAGDIAVKKEGEGAKKELLLNDDALSALHNYHVKWNGYVDADIKYV